MLNPKFKFIFIILFTVVASTAFAAPVLDWGLMVGDSANAPAGFRKDDLKPLDFRVGLGREPMGKRP